MTLIFLNAVVKSEDWYLYFDCMDNRVHRMVCKDAQSTTPPGCKSTLLNKVAYDCEKLKKSTNAFKYASGDSLNYDNMKPPKKASIPLEWNDTLYEVKKNVSVKAYFVNVGAVKPIEVKIKDEDTNTQVIHIKLEQRIIL